jgi:hypothetical protein
MKLHTSLVLLLVASFSYAQEEVAFKIRYQNYVKGDLTFISNNIVNKLDGKNANKPYNKLEESSKRNDELNMAYIDIDSDNETFSSSSASFKSKNNQNEVVFAGLYWSATYKNLKSKKSNEVYTGEGERESKFNEIKIKTPSNTNYTNITGEVIFDGYGKNNYKENAPYVCYADITQLVQEKPVGEYTVANIRATQGFLEGGVSGGWTIYIVYKDDLIHAKNISLYDGFAFIYNKPIDISFLNFLTPKEGNINTKIAMSVLEGDTQIDGDNLRIKNETRNKLSFISSEKRPENNFFNSQITIENDVFLDRNPASLNTLGYDAFITTLNNKGNKIIENNATQASLKMSSTGDKFYAFVTGFTTDVDEDFFEQNKKVEVKSKIVTEVKKIPVDKKEVVEVSQNDVSTIEEVPADNNAKNKIKSIKSSYKVLPPSSIYSIENNKNNNEEEIEEIKQFTDIPVIREAKPIEKLFAKTNSKNGYYLVVNVFSVTDNAKSFVKSLKKKSIDCNSFHNKETNLTYVYLKYSENLEEMQKTYDSNLDNTYFAKYWILELSK